MLARLWRVLNISNIDGFAKYVYRDYNIRCFEMLCVTVSGTISIISLDGVLMEPQAFTQIWFDQLGNCPLFSGLSHEELSKLYGLVRPRDVSAGETFILQDTEGDSFFIILEGKTEVFRQGDRGDKSSLGTVGAGECLGEMGCFSDGRRSASVRALEDTKLLEIDYSALDEVFDTSSLVARRFLAIVSERLRHTNLRFQELSQKSRLIENSLKNILSFLDMSDIIVLSTGIETLIQKVVFMASKIMNADRASLFLVDKIAGDLWSKVLEGDEMQQIRIPVGEGVAGWVAQHDEMVNITDAYTDARFNTEIDRRSGYRTKSILCGPINNFEGETVGVLQVINKKEGSFDKDDEALFRAFAYQTAIAVENFHLYKKMLNAQGKMVILLDVASSLTETLDLDTLIKKIVEKISEILDAERSTLFLLDRERNELWSKVAQGAEISEIRIPCSTGLAGYVATTGKGVNIRDAYKDDRFVEGIDQETGYRTRNLLCIPVHNREGEIIGVTQAINKKTGVFEKEDEDLLRAFSSQIGVALQNAQLYEETLNMKNYLESIKESITNGIITLDNRYLVVTANGASESLFKLEAKEIVNRDIREILGKENENLIGHIDHVYTSNRSVVEYDVEAILSGKRKHSFNINFFPLTDYEGDYRGQVLIFDDMTHEKRIKGTLIRYMARDIVEKVLEDPNEQVLGGARGKATILFSDIRGFTGIAESVTGEQTVNFLNDYFTRMVDIIFQFKGVLDKYMGDSIMAVFGVPYVREDDAERAVSTALRMRSELVRFNQRRRPGREGIRIGMGICTGEVISGNIGCEKRMDFTVIGDGVNIASRLEGLNKQYGTDILINDSTNEEIGEKFVTQLIDKVILEGRTKPVKVFHVLGEAGYRPTEAEKGFNKGIELYRKREFAKAIQQFEKASDIHPPSKVFLARCKYLLENPPEP